MTASRESAWTPRACWGARALRGARSVGLRRGGAVIYLYSCRSVGGGPPGPADLFGRLRVVPVAGPS